MKRIISIITALIMMLSLCVISVSATTPPAGYIGDANFDGNIDVSDATFILRSVAKLETPSLQQHYMGDADMDGKLTVLDATSIQRHEAKIYPCDYVGYFYNYDMLTNDFYSDFESGMAMVGVPVTFTMNADAGSPVISYNLFVDEVCVATSESNSITYTFDEPGDYNVRMSVSALFASGSMSYTEFKVVEPYESETPQFKTLYLTGKIQWGTIIYDVEDMAVFADAIGGKGPYQYKFVFERPENLDYESKILTISQEYSQDNVYELEEIKWKDVYCDGVSPYANLYCKLTVYIKDSNGVEISREMPIVYTGDVPIG